MKLFILLGFIFGLGAITFTQKILFRPSITLVDTSKKGEITIQGHHLQKLTAAYLKNNFLKANLKIMAINAGEKEQVTFKIPPEVKVNNSKQQHLLTLFISNAYGAATFPLTFSVSSSSSITDGSISAIKLNQMSASDGQLFKWNSLSETWEATDDRGLGEGGGTITAITPGVGFTSSVDITDNGTLNVNMGSTANKILTLTATARLPAISGANLTSLPADASVTDVAIANDPALHFHPYGTATGNTRPITFYEETANGTNTISLRAPDSLSSSMTWEMPSLDSTRDRFLVLNSSNQLTLKTLPEIINSELNNRDLSAYSTEVPLYLTLETSRRYCIASDNAADFPVLIEVEFESSSDHQFQLYFDAGGGTMVPEDSRGPINIPNTTINAKTFVNTPASRATAAATYNDAWSGANPYVHAGGNLKCTGLYLALWPNYSFVPGQTTNSIMWGFDSIKIRGWK